MSAEPQPEVGARLENGKPVLDEVSRRVLEELQREPRLSMSELARRAGVSAPTATERVQRMERAGVIRGYRVDVDPAALGLPVTVYVRVRPGPGQLRKIAELVPTIPQVVECHRITGDDCFLLRLQLPTVNALEEVLDRFLLYGQTTTSIVQSSPVPLRDPQLPDR